VHANFQLFCVRSGIPPTRFEEFLVGLFIRLPFEICVHRLPQMFEEDKRWVQALLISCGKACLEDNIDQFLFYTLGNTIQYPNLKNYQESFLTMARHFTSC